MATFRSCLKISQPLPKSRNSHTHSFPHIAPLLPFQFANQNFHPHLLSSFLTFKKFYVIIFKKTIFSFALPSLHPHIPLSPLTPLTSLPLNLYPYIFNRHLPHLPNTQLSFLLLIFIKKYVIILKKSIFYSLLTTVIAYSKSPQHHSIKENGETYHTSIGSFRLIN